jgi:hypothetical protein
MSLTGGCVVQALWEGKRLDGRGLMDGRDIDITFGLDWGSCQVTLGRSRVLAQVSHPKQRLFNSFLSICNHPKSLLIVFLLQEICTLYTGVRITFL